MRPLPVRDRHKVDCSNCYGNGCAMCSHRGWFETQEGRDEREDAEEQRAEAQRERNW